MGSSSPAASATLAGPDLAAPATPAGPDLAASLEALQPAELTDAELLETICRWERLAAWVASGQLAAVAELARRRRADGENGHPGASSVSEFAVDELAAALRLSRPAAGARLVTAVDLAERLPDTAAALRSGELDVPKVRAIVDGTTALEGQVAQAVEDRVLPDAPLQTLGQLRASVARAVLAVDPAGAEERHERAAAGRRVIFTPLPDGMASLWALLPADGAARLRSAVETLARRPIQPDDIRGMDARRADALVELAGSGSGASGPSGASGSSATSGAAAAAGNRPLVHVTVPASTLLGLSDEPGELAGHGPIPASMARQIAAEGTWRRILTDPSSGAVLDVGRTTYNPPAGIADHVKIRDGTCRFPGCRQPARRCDLDHVRPYPAGPTSAANLIALCRHHHRLKHRGRWRVLQEEDGSVIWTSPTGHCYRSAPRSYRSEVDGPQSGPAR
jgi:Domain of unknown function (DUF222)